MAVNCNLQTLLTNAKCYLDQCNSEAERQAIKILFLVLGLAAAGGEAYTPQSLQVAAKSWQALSDKQLSAIDVYLSGQSAVESGATLPGNIDAIKDAAKCYQCIPEQTRKQLLEFLHCALSNLAAPG